MYRSSSSVFALLALLLAHGGAPADRIPDDLNRLLDRAEQFELFSLDPGRSAEKPPDHFHGWKVLGKTTVKDAKVREKLVAAFRKGVEDNPGMIANCFEPRHGIRVRRGCQTVDFVICFSCHRVLVFVDGQEAKGFLVMDSPHPVFDAVLKEAKVRLPPPPGVLKYEEPKP